ncbi:MAG: sugar ABC transporter permease [Clostridiales bacterium]|nr:MAG: sugar ABC transporter permease [Clostridiales bacterium]
MVQSRQAVRPKTGWQKIMMRIREHAGFYILLLPSLVLLIIFTYIPMYGVIIAFKNFKPINGIWGSDWVGWYNFERFFSQASFWNILTNTLTLSIYSLIAGFPIPIILALMLNNCEFAKFKKSVQMITYAPHFISTVVFVGMLNVFFAPSMGIIQQFLNLLGLADGPLRVLMESEAFPHLYVWSGVWQGMGWGSIVYLAALSGVDPTLHEAAVVDGANKLQRMRYIDLPCIVPTIVTLLILNCGNVLNVGFEKVYLMQNSMNLTNSEIISTYVYKMGLLNSQYSYSTAIGLFNSVINMILLITVDRISKRMGQDGLF